MGRFTWNLVSSFNPPPPNQLSLVLRNTTQAFPKTLAKRTWRSTSRSSWPLSFRPYVHSRGLTREGTYFWKCHSQPHVQKRSSPAQSSPKESQGPTYPRHFDNQNNERKQDTRESTIIHSVSLLSRQTRAAGFPALPTDTGVPCLKCAHDK